MVSLTKHDQCIMNPNEKINNAFSLSFNILQNEKIITDVTVFLCDVNCFGLKASGMLETEICVLCLDTVNVT